MSSKDLPQCGCEQIPVRLFLVGCSRSGTTIVQRAITERYRIYSLPETDFFGLAVAGGLGALVCKIGLARTPSIYERAFDRLERLMNLDHGITNQLRYRRMQPLVERFVDILDNKAVSEGESGWLEKTPKHFRHTRLIKRYIADAQIVHVVRQGPDVVASIRDRAVRYPEEFGRQQNPIYGIKLWNRAIKAALRDASQEQALILKYETFAENPDAVIIELGRRLGLTHRKSTRAHATNIIGKNESWKKNASDKIKPAQSKFSEVFDVDTQQSILSKLDLQTYESVISYSLV